MILRFLHGWGWDAPFWERLTAALPGWRCEADDRGYFGAPQEPAWDEPCIVVAHSFGAMRALTAMPATCRGLVAINGFDRFTPGVSPRIIERMILRFEKDPTTVLADFRRRCGSEEPFGPLDAERLQTDLQALRDDDRSGEAERWLTPILSIQGGHDPLLPAPMRDAVFAGAPLLERMTHPGGGHLLPLEDASWCARAIAAFAERLA